jgi:LmbE family N-acetylglucosaminyl deacetylase
VPETSDLSTENVIATYLSLLKQPLVAPNVAGIPISTTLPKRDEERPCAVLLTPHPDDECLTGVLPLRLRREKNWQVINIGVTLGSNLSRRTERQKELSKACAVLGFDCALPEENGFDDIHAQGREDTELWDRKVGRIVEILEQLRPQAVFLPHEADWHATHVGTHLLGMDALARMPQDFACSVVQTEYWQPMTEPNTLIGAGKKDVVRLTSALACHAGEVERNAYDRRFPAYLIDAVRRSEPVLGQGKQAPAMDFAELYKIGTWLRGKFIPSALNRVLGAESPLGDLFES